VPLSIIGTFGTGREEREKIILRLLLLLRLGELMIDFIGVEKPATE